MLLNKKYNVTKKLDFSITPCVTVKNDLSKAFLILTLAGIWFVYSLHQAQDAFFDWQLDAI